MLRLKTALFLTFLFAFQIWAKDYNISKDKDTFSALTSENLEGIKVDMRYNTENNFTLERVDGYKANVCYLHSSVMEKLMLVHQDLLKKGYGLYLFDCYRPQKAVDHFVRWATSKDQMESKKKFYPKLEKNTLFQSGYIASRSGHSRGSTVDLSIYSTDDKTQSPVEMGTSWDFFSPKSHTASKNISSIAQKNRVILKEAMEKRGFENYKKEWWHFTFKPEPTPNIYFNFNVTTPVKK